MLLRVLAKLAEFECPKQNSWLIINGYPLSSSESHVNPNFHFELFPPPSKTHKVRLSYIIHYARQILKYKIALHLRYDI